MTRRESEHGLLEEREHIEGHDHAQMLSVEDARERVLGFFGVLPIPSASP